MKKFLTLLLHIQWASLPCTAQEAKGPQSLRQTSLQNFGGVLQHFHETGSVGDLYAAEKILDNQNGLQLADQCKCMVQMLAAIETFIESDNGPQPRIYNRVPPPTGYEHADSPYGISDLKVREKYLKDISENNARAEKWQNQIQLRKWKETCVLFFTNNSSFKQRQSNQLKTDVLKSISEAQISATSKTTLREVLAKTPVKEPENTTGGYKAQSDVKVPK